MGRHRWASPKNDRVAIFCARKSDLRSLGAPLAGTEAGNEIDRPIRHEKAQSKKCL